ncbi:MAG: 3-deoxy-D-manno-octulosonic acid transferase, partial [Alphaproteobacteria bacterium]|nr:3-deoxy-D-manno-octulosonic acid transferase [Alphaproteobacteria bacterium]
MLLLYQTLTTLAEPLLLLLLRLRVRQGKEDPARWLEKTGIPSLPRPLGTLVWFHAASVGESKAVLPLISQYLAAHEDRSVLITTGTRTAAALLSGQLPPRAVHQFAPLDNPRWLRRFLAHWQPNALVLVESELWPNMLQETAKRAPVALINARMSPRSQRRWGRFNGLAR